MKDVRVTIDGMMRARGVGTLSPNERALIQAAIDADQPPGEEKMCAALLELDQATPNCELHFYGFGGGVIMRDGKMIGRWYSNTTIDEITAAVRLLIPKPPPEPESTEEEDWREQKLRQQRKQ